MRGPLRKIVRRTHPSSRLRRVQVFPMRGPLSTNVGPVFQHHRVRTWHARLECGHDYEMPYGQRRVKRMRCPRCAKEEKEVER